MNLPLSNDELRDQAMKEGTDLSLLLGRVEKASGPDRELDGHLYGALGFQIIQRFGGFEWRPEGKGVWRTMPSPTASLDAALALVERVLPGWHVQITSIGAPWSQWEACVSEPSGTFLIAEDVERYGQNATPALALLAALLKAMEASRG